MTAIAVGNTSIIVSNGDYQAAVSVIVNTSDKSFADDKAENETDNIEESTILYDNIVSASDVSKIDSEMLKYLYDNKTSLLISGDGYSITLDGKNIVNYKNEFITDIKLANLKTSNSLDAEILNSNNIEGVCFEINDSNPLCGDITLCLDNVKGKYLYLYNESKEQYELLADSDFSMINISSPGRYLITNSKIRTGNWMIVIMLIVGGIALLVGIGVYIGIKKQYWFW